MQPILILGAKGTLGGQLRRLYPEARAWDREEADVTDFDALASSIRALDPAPPAIVNCVAFNDVDGAESNPAAAHALNAEFPGRLAALAGSLGIPLVHYSTNYVFDGLAGEYDETAVSSPLSVYGKSKADGEAAVAAATPLHYIVRTAVLFGPQGESTLSKKSFVGIMLELSARTDSIKAVSDEINSMTYSPDLAAGTRLLLDEKRPSGIYHVTNAGGASWYDCAAEIFRAAGRNIRLEPVPAAAFPRKARRPAKAVLLNTKLPPFRHWTDAIAEFVARS